MILSRSFPKRLSFERTNKKERRPVFSKKERSVVRILLPSVFEVRWCFCLREKTTFLRAFSLRFFFFFTKILRLFFVVTFVVIKKGVTTKTASSSKERKKMSLEFKVSLKKNKKDEKRERERGESDSLVLLFGQFFSRSRLDSKKVQSYRTRKKKKKKKKKKTKKKKKGVSSSQKWRTPPPPPPPTPTKSRRRNIPPQ